MTSPSTPRRQPADLLLATEALALLTLFRLCLAVIPVHKIIRTITRRHIASADTPTDQAIASALQVRWAIEAIARHSPIRFVCFPQTLAGYAMLRRRRIPSTMVYGVARSPQGDLTAHTWLMIGDRTVVGGEGSAAFTPVDRWT
jgi:hypothetical protein